MLGGVNNADIFGMSGGWRRGFDLPATAEVIVEFNYNLTISSQYEPDELGQVIVTLDGLQPESGGNDYVAQIVGNGNGGNADSTDWQTFTVNVGSLTGGNHTLTIGGYNNKKTYGNETVEVLIDNVRVSTVQ